MAKGDFDKYVRGLSYTLREDVESLQKAKEALALGETDEQVFNSIKKAYEDDRYKLEIFLFAKHLLDKPKRTKKQARWQKQSKLPTEMPKGNKDE